MVQLVQILVNLINFFPYICVCSIKRIVKYLLCLICLWNLENIPMLKGHLKSESSRLYIYVKKEEFALLIAIQVLRGMW